MCLSIPLCYAIDFGSMTQKNTSTGRKRKIKCPSQIQADACYTSSVPRPTPAADWRVSSISGDQSVHYQWLYKNDEGVYTPYRTVHSQIIEQMYQGQSSQQIIGIGKWAYSFNFQDMKQVNIKTNTRRSIRRKLVGANQATNPVLSPSSYGHILENSKPKSSLHKERDSFTLTSPKAVAPTTQSPSVHDPQHYIGLRGPKLKLEEATRTIKSKLQSLSVTKSVSLPSRLTAASVFKHKLESIIKKHNFVHIHRTNEASAVAKESVLVEGEEQKVLSAVTDIQSEIINLSADDTHYPEEWEAQVNTCEVFEVTKGSREWRRVSSKFKETMPDNEITSIKRVQNMLLWDKYENIKKLKVKNGGSVNEMDLFHGSRKVSADIIVHSEEGFDMRFSSQGMWGQANYFAVNASYSDTYAYQHSADQTKEVLLAKVLTGDSITLPSDKSLRMPPEKLTSFGTGVALKQVRYDTVNGTTHGSKVYMTYSNDKAYPAYIITYRRCLARPRDPFRLRGTSYNIMGQKYMSTFGV